MVQYGIWNNCSNQCEFCLIKDETFFPKEKMLSELERTIQNLDYIDWKNEFSRGISLLGGELYYITDKDLQNKFLELIDAIIEKILKVSEDPLCRYSSVTNGLYDPTFLYQVIDRIKDAVGMRKIDINFSFDLKYRFKSDKDKQTVIDNINAFHKRYNYILGIQMVLTQYIIDAVLNGWKLSIFMNEIFPGNRLALLYPHPIFRGKYYGETELKDFNFTRRSFLKFLPKLQEDLPFTYRGFIESTKNSATFKHTGLFFKGDTGDEKQKPILCDGKELLNPQCGHSILYQCYSDTDKCMLCDIVTMDG